MFRSLGYISNDFTINNMKKKTGLKGIAKFLSVDLILLMLTIF